LQCRFDFLAKPLKGVARGIDLHRCDALMVSSLPCARLGFQQYRGHAVPLVNR
jgi:hypothetical protein